MSEYRYTVLYEPVPEGGYNVTVPAFPEICTCGDTLEEARAMAADAIKCVIESMQKDHAAMRRHWYKHHPYRP